MIMKAFFISSKNYLFVRLVDRNRRSVQTKTMSNSKVFYENANSSTLSPAIVHIISNAKYEGLPENIENELDIAKLESSFSRFNIRPVVHREKTADEIRSLMQKRKFHFSKIIDTEKNNQFSVKNSDFTLESAVMVIIIANGVKKGKVHAKDELYDLDSEIFQPIINNPTLAKKPKIFIVEANRGSKEFDSIANDAVSFGRKPSEIIKLFSNYEGEKNALC